MKQKVKKFLSRYPMLMKYAEFFFRLTEGNYFVYRCLDFTQRLWVKYLVKAAVTPFSLIRYWLPVRIKPSEGEGVALVLIAKNEAPYIKEWLDFHLKQGVSHFIIYDNESTDNFREVVSPYINAGIVSYHVITGRNRQKDAYNMALHDYGRKFKYMGIIDADEFMFVRNSGGGTSNLYSFVDEFMTSHPNAGGLAVNWCIFGSNGHLTKPEGGVLENYTRRAEDSFEDHSIVKTICDPTKVFSYGQVHYPLYFRGFHSLDEDGTIVPRATTTGVHFKKIRINHYFTKSFEEFKIKRTRGKADIPGLRSMSEFNDNNRNEVLDTEILSHI